MYNNEYLEKCLEENKGSGYLLRAYMNTVDKEYRELVVNDLGFIYNSKDELELFKDELIKADIKEFVLTETSTALMNVLHAFDSVGIKFKEVTKVSRMEYSYSLREDIEVFTEGLRMIVE
jgi:DNA-binding transcriptional regulator YhcF (GntR family)